LLCSEAAADCSHISSTFYGSSLTEILPPLALTLNAMSMRGAQALLFARQGKGGPSRARLGQPDGDGLLRRSRRNR
jgi:hypothetical protein